MKQLLSITNVLDTVLLSSTGKSDLLNDKELTEFPLEPEDTLLFDPVTTLSFT
ncbi:hypothetical protein C942_03540 [Photobacterium marinum]|uniref:Uncharacterized protein n=1 Tax=Photobacterium marinum TaxID=1056511 RepID=L8J7F4_9GAMM|nr:hypothetical protein C942_03540 [Photobacterium marinum]